MAEIKRETLDFRNRSKRETLDFRYQSKHATHDFWTKDRVTLQPRAAMAVFRQTVRLEGVRQFTDENLPCGAP